MKPSPHTSPRGARGVTLIEVMIAVALAVGITLTSIGSVIYYQKTVSKNDRVARLANLIEGQMEKVRNRTWFELVNPTNGLMPPGGSGSSVWPSHDGPFIRYKSDSLSVELIKDGTISSTNYTGLSGKVDIYYTPITWTHEATDRLGTTVRYDVNYYKIEVIVTLDESSRIRPGTGEDVWGAVTYLSELSGRDDPEFSQRVLEVLRQKQY
ncbi:hypothetical protein GC173_00105 [bacterium]|nr:hypothetical protein [bacterium]